MVVLGRVAGCAMRISLPHACSFGRFLCEPLPYSEIISLSVRLQKALIFKTFHVGLHIMVQRNPPKNQKRLQFSKKKKIKMLVGILQIIALSDSESDNLRIPMCIVTIVTL